MREIENKNFVMKETWHDRIAIGNLKTYGEGMYIEENQIDDLIEALQNFKKQKEKKLRNI